MAFYFHAYTDIPDVKVIYPKRINDERGWFMESYVEREFLNNGIRLDFIQENHSCSQAGVLTHLFKILVSLVCREHHLAAGLYVTRHCQGCRELDIRFVFSNPNTKIYKGSKTTVAQWCEKYNFKYATKYIPTAWLKEGKKSTEGLIKKKK